MNILLVIRAMKVRMPHCKLKWEKSVYCHRAYPVKGQHTGTNVRRKI